MTGRVTDGIRRACGIAGGLAPNEFATVEVRKAAVAEACDMLDEAVGAVRQDAWDEGFEAGRERSIEDREAAAWVREHGGIAYVKDAWNVRSNLDRQLEKAQAKVERQQRHIEFVQGKCHERLVRIAALNKTVAEMRPRLMPEGMEWLLEVWPRWSNGEYCRFGDWWTADRYSDYEPRQLRRLVIYTPELLDEWEQGDGESYGYEWDFTRPSELGYRPDKAEPPAPKVLAADGEPLEVGQTVWCVSNGIEFTVVGLPKSGEYQAVRLQLDDGAFTGLDPDQLTHQRPDSWERLEEDAWDDDCEYFGRDMNDCKGCPASRQDIDDFYCDENEKARDLVRRAKALAGKED